MLLSKLSRAFKLLIIARCSINIHKYKSMGKKLECNFEHNLAICAVNVVVVASMFFTTTRSDKLFTLLRTAAAG
jgi:hypothetical protein